MYIRADPVLPDLGSLDGLHEALRTAIRLEHATIPPYLYALYSLKPVNRAAADVIRSVVTEEMAHMVLAANVLAALGARPDEPDSQFVTSYPNPLPDLIAEDLDVGLRPFSKDVVKSVFMEIEEPTREDPEGMTIGRFYGDIIDALRELPESAFVADRTRQLLWPWRIHQSEPRTASPVPIEVTDKDSAIRALDLIIDQGEGTNRERDAEGQLAHYYRFERIVTGEIPFDPAGVWNVPINPRLSDYDADSPARAACETFNRTYTGLLRSLHSAIDGNPGRLSGAIGLMHSLSVQAAAMVSSVSADGKALEFRRARQRHAAPTFEYLTADATAR
jgi:rubrerythrin